MKQIVILVMIGVIGGLWLDDHFKRVALDRAQAQIQDQSDMAQQIESLTAQVTHLKLQLNTPSAAPSASSTVTWFQQRLNEHTTLDPVGQNGHY